jgi:uncharacterized protein (DUF2235 family)
MAKNIVICCDGTGNQVSSNPAVGSFSSNILKLFQIVEKDAAQRVRYQPGVGTIGTDDAWTRLKQNTKAVFELATGYGLDDEILGAYRFLVEQYMDGDAVFLFGFSRGSYTVRALAAFIHMVGLLNPDQANISDYALTSYKQSSEQNDFHLAWDFGRITAARRITIKFIGVWDTVASLIVPRWDRLIPTLQTLPYTATNSSVEIFRQAMAIDERRRLFRLNRWRQPQDFIANPFDSHTPKVAQDIKQVWFAGVHSDVGGGYPENESGLSKFPLAWLIDEATTKGLRINAALRDHLVFGKPYFNSRHQYVPPNAAAKLHESLTWAWKLIEWVPKRTKYEEWPDRTKFDGFYIPCGEPRPIENPVKPRIHQSVIDRKTLVPDYKPVNFPAQYDVEPWPYAPGSGAAAAVQPPAA